MLEQSCVVWHSALTEENAHDLERIQKASLKIILKENYKSYENALEILDLDNLAKRREMLCLSFAKKCLKNEKMRQYFSKNLKIHQMKTRNQEVFNINTAHTERLKKSPITFMQYLLNKNQ